MDPFPYIVYVIFGVICLKDEEFSELYLLEPSKLHVLQWLSANHVIADPVSKITFTCCEVVPILIEAVSCVSIAVERTLLVVNSSIMLSTTLQLIVPKRAARTI